MYRVLRIAAATALLLSVVVAAQSISVQFDGTSFRVEGWHPPSVTPTGGWQAVFVIYAGDGDVPPLVGSYAIDHGSLVFRPKYPLARGPRYRAVFHAPGAEHIERTFPTARDQSTRPSTRVERVYPSADVLPSNQLRLYIYFSAPMSRGEAEQRIHLLDGAGKELRRVFLPGQELWDPNNRRLTMTFDPGRIKRDLTSNRSMGPPIVDGKRYTLLIDSEWRDANGTPLAESFRKAFRGGPAMREPPNPKTWKISAPPGNSREAMVVDFGRPMNYTLLQRMITVAGPAGGLAGTIQIDANESRWRFTPQQPWRPGAYRLVVDTSLEDLAGNKIDLPFDIDVFEKVTERIVTATTSIGFEIRSTP